MTESTFPTHCNSMCVYVIIKYYVNARLYIKKSNTALYIYSLLRCSFGCKLLPIVGSKRRQPSRSAPIRVRFTPRSSASRQSTVSHNSYVYTCVTTVLKFESLYSCLLSIIGKIWIVLSNREFMENLYIVLRCWPKTMSGVLIEI